VGVRIEKVREFGLLACQKRKKNNLGGSAGGSGALSGTAQGREGDPTTSAQPVHVGGRRPMGGLNTKGKREKREIDRKKETQKTVAVFQKANNEWR